MSDQCLSTFRLVGSGLPGFFEVERTCCGHAVRRTVFALVASVMLCLGSLATAFTSLRLLLACAMFGGFVFGWHWSLMPVRAQASSMPGGSLQDPPTLMHLPPQQGSTRSLHWQGQRPTEVAVPGCSPGGVQAVLKMHENMRVSAGADVGAVWAVPLCEQPQRDACGAHPRRLDHVSHAGGQPVSTIPLLSGTLSDLAHDPLMLCIAHPFAEHVCNVR